jgi:uridine kinase
VEGIFALANEEIRSLADLKIYIDADDDLRAIRRIKRRHIDYPSKRPLSYTIDWYQVQIKPGHEKFVEPTKKYADLNFAGNSMDEFEQNTQKLLQYINMYFEDKQTFTKQLKENKSLSEVKNENQPNKKG